MPTLRVRLLGGFRLRMDGSPLPRPGTRKACALLAYLLVHRDRAHPREVLAGLFWPDHPTDKALRSLSTALWHIRNVLPGDEYILAGPQTVSFNVDSDYWLDVDAFVAKSAVRMAEPPGDVVEREKAAEVVVDLEDAVALYRGEFMEGHYDDWCLQERYHLEVCYLETLQGLIVRHEALGAPQEALRYAELLLARDPLREDIQCAAIRLHAALGNHAEAVRQAWWCRAVLLSELGTELSPETVALCDQLLGPAWRREPDERLSIETSVPPRRGAALLLDRPPFVGREAEWKTLLSHWERVCSGQGHVVLVSGEAGVGKTRLVEELAQHVQQRGNGVFKVRCYEYERQLPYGPLADLLRGIVASGDASVFERLPAWQLAELALLAPDLAAHLPAPAAARTGDRWRPRILRAVTHLLFCLAEKAPLMLALEDAHWINDSTLAWLHYLARRVADAPVLLVATYRSEEVGPDHPLRGMALQLRQEALATDLELSCLSQAALARWMVGADETLVMRVHRQTEGNPFFILETLRALVEDGAIRFEDGRWVEEGGADALPVPSSVSELIEVRLARLSSTARQLASVAAVMGHTFDSGVVEHAYGQEEEAALAGWDELLRRRLVEEGDSPSVAEYQFSHHLVREVIYQGLHYRRRRRLHRLVGEAMEGLYASADPEHSAGQMAHHFERAHEPERALTWLVVAGEQARRSYAQQEALGYFRRALDLLDPQRADGLAARALTGLAAVHREVVGEEVLVWKWLERALAIWEALEDPRGIAETCYSLAYQYADFDAAQAAVRWGLNAVQGVDGLESLVAHGYGLLARFSEHAGEFADARRWAEQQRRLGERVGDQSALAHAHHRLGSLLLRMGGPMREALRHEQQAARLAEGLGWLDFAAGSHNITGRCLVTLGRTAEGEAACRLALRLSTDLEIPWRQCWAYHYLADIAMLWGRWREAAQLLDRAEQTMIYQSTHFQEIVLLRARGQLARWRGDLGAARPPLETALDMSQRFYPRFVPELHLELAELDLSEDEIAARQHLRRAREAAETSEMGYALGWADRLEGRLAARARDGAAADAAFSRSLRRFEELEQVLEAARTRLAWGRASLHRDPARARDLLESAIITFEAAEAGPEAAAARDLLAHC